MEFIYKERRYNWDEWNTLHNRFIEELELPDDFLIDIGLRDFSLIHDIGYGIAIDKIRELYSMLASARSALINAHEKFYDSNIISWESGYKGQLWMRFQYLKNSSVWYNSCEDYIYQVLWFAYDMYSNEIFSQQEYLNALKTCSYNKIKQVLQKNKSKDANKLQKIIKAYRFDSDVKYLREELANNFKHRANVQVKGLEDLRLVGYKSDKFDSDWIQPNLIDIDESIELIARVHRKLLIFGREIIMFLKLEEIFEKDDKGNNILNKIRSKDKYKRFIVKNRL